MLSSGKVSLTIIGSSNRIRMEAMVIGMIHTTAMKASGNHHRAVVKEI
jgi:hypothetical protein